MPIQPFSVGSLPWVRGTATLEAAQAGHKAGIESGNAEASDRAEIVKSAQVDRQLDMQARAQMAAASNASRQTSLAERNQSFNQEMQMRQFPLEQERMLLANRQSQINAETSLMQRGMNQEAHWGQMESLELRNRVDLATHINKQSEDAISRSENYAVSMWMAGGSKGQTPIVTTKEGMSSLIAARNSHAAQNGEKLSLKRQLNTQDAFLDANISAQQREFGLYDAETNPGSAGQAQMEAIVLDSKPLKGLSVSFIDSIVSDEMNYFPDKRGFLLLTDEAKGRISAEREVVEYKKEYAPTIVSENSIVTQEAKKHIAEGFQVTTEVNGFGELSIVKNGTYLNALNWQRREAWLEKRRQGASLYASIQKGDGGGGGAKSDSYDIARGVGGSEQEIFIDRHAGLEPQKLKHFPSDTSGGGGGSRPGSLGGGGGGGSRPGSLGGGGGGGSRPGSLGGGWENGHDSRDDLPTGSSLSSRHAGGSDSGGSLPAPQFRHYSPTGYAHGGDTPSDDDRSGGLGDQLSRQLYNWSGGPVTIKGDSEAAMSGSSEADWMMEEGTRTQNALKGDHEIRRSAARNIETMTAKLGVKAQPRAVRGEAPLTIDRPPDIDDISRAKYNAGHDLHEGIKKDILEYAKDGRGEVTDSQRNEVAERRNAADVVMARSIGVPEIDPNTIREFVVELHQNEAVGRSRGWEQTFKTDWHDHPTHDPIFSNTKIAGYGGDPKVFGSGFTGVHGIERFEEKTIGHFMEKYNGIVAGSDVILRGDPRGDSLVSQQAQVLKNMNYEKLVELIGGIVLSERQRAARIIDSDDADQRAASPRPMRGKKY